MFVAALYASSSLVAGLGVVYLVSRIVYWRAHMADPSRRGFGFLLSVAPTFALLGIGLAGAVGQL